MKNYLILNRLPNKRLNYEAVIDHTKNQVTYIGYFSATYQFKGPATLIEADLTHLDVNNLPEKIYRTLLSCDCLIARSEFDLLLAAKLREAFNIAGETSVDVLPVRDKFIMRRLAQKHKIRQPEFWSLPQFQNNTAAIDKYVLKPRLDASSNGVLIGNRQEIINSTEKITRPEQWLIEAYIPGEIYHIDGFIEQGFIKTMQTSKYINTCLNYASGAPLGSAQIPEPSWAKSFTEKITQALRYANGSLHLEVIVDQNDQPYFLEFAGRVGGSYVVETFELKTGINLHQCDLKMLIGREIDWPNTRNEHRYFGSFIFPYGAKISSDFSASAFQNALLKLEMNPHPAIPSATSYLSKHSPMSGIVQAQMDCDQLVLRIMSSASKTNTPVIV